MRTFLRCAHRLTAVSLSRIHQGVDPTAEQWDKILDVFLQKKHYAFFDSAYQGFATGDLDRDAGSMRMFADKKVPMLVCQVSRPRSVPPRYTTRRGRGGGK